MLVEDDWVKEAMTDDDIVADLLLRLKQDHALTPIKPTAEESGLPPPRWGVRQTRTRLAFRGDVTSPAKGSDSRKNSPITPLFWTAGTSSSSGTAEGSDDSDLRGYGFSRSKGNESRCPSTATFNKPRRKKSFDRLTKEETLMLSGRAQLMGDELSNLKDQRDEHQKLNKRMKLDLTAEIHKSTSFTATPLPYSGSVSSTLHEHHEEALEPIQKQEKTGFMLPDLNEPYSDMMMI